MSKRPHSAIDIDSDPKALAQVEDMVIAGLNAGVPAIVLLQVLEWGPHIFIPIALENAHNLMRTSQDFYRLIHQQLGEAFRERVKQATRRIEQWGGQTWSSAEFLVGDLFALVHGCKYLPLTWFAREFGHTLGYPEITYGQAARFYESFPKWRYWEYVKEPHTTAIKNIHKLWWHKMSDGEQQRLRDTILPSLNSLHLIAHVGEYYERITNSNEISWTTLDFYWPQEFIFTRILWHLFEALSIREFDDAKMQEYAQRAGLATVNILRCGLRRETESILLDYWFHLSSPPTNELVAYRSCHPQAIEPDFQAYKLPSTRLLISSLGARAGPVTDQMKEGMQERSMEETYLPFNAYSPEGLYGLLEWAIEEGGNLNVRQQVSEAATLLEWLRTPDIWAQVLDTVALFLTRPGQTKWFDLMVFEYQMNNQNVLHLLSLIPAPRPPDILLRNIFFSNIFDWVMTGQMLAIRSQHDGRPVLDPEASLSPFAGRAKSLVDVLLQHMSLCFQQLGAFPVPEWTTESELQYSWQIISFINTYWKRKGLRLEQRPFQHSLSATAISRILYWVKEDDHVDDDYTSLRTAFFEQCPEGVDAAKREYKKWDEWARSRK